MSNDLTKMSKPIFTAYSHHIIEVASDMSYQL